MSISKAILHFISKLLKIVESAITSNMHDPSLYHLSHPWTYLTKLNATNTVSIVIKGR